MTPDGILEERLIPSSRDSSVSYPMVRTASGWQHADAGCEAWGYRNRCRHVEELNMTESENGGTKALAVIEQLEDRAIIASITGQVTGAWVYSFSQGGQTVEGLSVDGVEAAARECAKRGEAIREMEVRLEYEDDTEARFVAKAGRFAIADDGRELLLDTAIRAKRQPKNLRLKTGEVRFDEHWYEKGIAKAARNAKEALLSEEIKAFIIAQARKAKRVRDVPADEESAQGRPRTAAGTEDGHSQFLIAARQSGLSKRHEAYDAVGLPDTDTGAKAQVAGWAEQAGLDPQRVWELLAESLTEVIAEAARSKISIAEARAVVDPLARLRQGVAARNAEALAAESPTEEEEETKPLPLGFTR